MNTVAGLRIKPVELDRQGRVRIPQELVELVGLGREVVLLGVQDHLELWDRQRWEAYLAQKQNCYDEIAESAFSGSPHQETIDTSPLVRSPK